MPEGSRKIGAEVFVQASQARDELKGVQADVKGVGAAAQETNAKASAAMNGVASSTKAAAAAFGEQSKAAMGAAASTAELANQKAALLGQIKNVEGLIRGETKVLADAQSAVKQYGAGQKALDTALADSQAKLAGYIQQQDSLKAQLNDVTAQMRRSTVATDEKAASEEVQKISALEAARAEQALALANVETAETATLTAGATIRTGAAVDKLAGVSVGGARALSLLAGGISAVGIGQIALIAGASLLIGELLALAKAKDELIQLDEEGLKIDADRNVSMHTGALFTKERATVMHDFVASNVALGQALVDLSQKEKAEEAARRAATESLVSEKREASEVALLFGVFGQTTEQLTKKEALATAARVEATAAVHKQIESYIKLALETHLSAEATLEMARHTGAEKAVLDALTAALDSAYFATLRFKSGQNLISETRFKVAFDAAKAGEVLNHAEAQRRYNAEIAKGGEETVKLARETELAEKNMHAFTETHHGGAAAARAYANELVNLKKQAQDALAALNADNFAARDARIANDIQAERDHLKINKRDREEALQYIAVREKALHDKVAQDRAIAEQRLADEIRGIEIAGIQDAYDREVASLNLKLQQKSLALQQEFGVTEQSEQLILRMKRAYEDEFQRWFVERNLKTFEQLTTEGGRFEHQLNAARAKEDEAYFKGQLKEWEQHEKQIQALIDKFSQRSGGHVSVVNINEIERINSRLNALGLSVKGVDDHFGHATSNIRVFELRLKALELYNKGDFFGGLRASIKAVALDFLESGRAADQMGNLIQSTFDSATSAGGDFISAFGAALVQGVTQIVAQVLGQLGIQLIAKGIADVLQGIAWNANPLTPGLGTPLIAAGHAEIIQGAAFSALAGIASGLGNLASNAIKGGDSAASGAAGGGSTSSTVGGTPRATQPQPIIIDLSNASANRQQNDFSRIGFTDQSRSSSQRPMQVSIQLNENAWSKLMRGQKVLTATNIQHEHKSTFAKVVKRIK
ncbi:MAG TPA: hypothetical protein VJ464_15825 [Blastocatellia bacterium]|nr:hypothetical protein [Blastocatellia bacterium]